MKKIDLKAELSYSNIADVRVKMNSGIKQSHFANFEQRKN